MFLLDLQSDSLNNKTCDYISNWSQIFDDKFLEYMFQQRYRIHVCTETFKNIRVNASLAQMHD